MTFTVGRLCERHIKGAAAVLMAAYADPPWNENWTTEVALAAMTDIIEMPRSISLVAVEDDNVLGIACGIRQHRYTGPVLYLDELSVLPSAQRRGIGRSLLAATLAVARAEGCMRVWLVTEAEGAASEFYRRCGFARSAKLGLFSGSTE